MANNAVINLMVAVNELPASVAGKLTALHDEGGMGLYRALTRYLVNVPVTRGFKGRVRIDDCTSNTDNVADTQSITNTITQASLVDATDTLVFNGGRVTLTWKTSPSGENEVAIGASDTAAGDNLAAKINAHSKLKGIFTATNAAGVVTIVCNLGPRELDLMGVTETGNGQVLSATNFALDTTDSYESDTLTFTNGLP